MQCHINKWGIDMFHQTAEPKLPSIVYSTAEFQSGNCTIDHDMMLNYSTQLSLSVYDYMLILNRDHNSVERILIKETSKHTFHFTAFTRIYTSAPLIIAAKSIYSDSSDAIIEQQQCIQMQNSQNCIREPTFFLQKQRIT